LPSYLLPHGLLRLLGTPAPGVGGLGLGLTLLPSTLPPRVLLLLGTPAPGGRGLGSELTLLPSYLPPRVLLLLGTPAPGVRVRVRVNPLAYVPTPSYYSYLRHTSSGG